MLNTITRDGAVWVQTAPGAQRYSPRWDNGHLFLHANRKCCHLKHPVVVSPRSCKPSGTRTPLRAAPSTTSNGARNAPPSAWTRNRVGPPYRRV